MSEVASQLPTEPCSIAIKCANDPRIVRCLDSIDDPTVAINAVITPSPVVQALLEVREIPYTLTEYGNIAKSAELSVEQAAHDNVIVMDSDVYFAPGAIGRLRQALTTSTVAKPRLVFSDTGSRISYIIADSRRSFNARPDFATNPGLAIRRQELAEKCRGYVFNPNVRWTEDADLNFRMLEAGVGLTYVPDAILHHDPVSLSHELKCAFLYGVGKRLSVENTPGRTADEELGIVLRNLKQSFGFEGASHTIQDHGLDTVALGVVWRGLYLAGYHAQKTLGKWSTDPSQA